MKQDAAGRKGKFAAAFSGLGRILKDQSVVVHLCIGLAVIILGWFLQLDREEFLILLFTIGMVLLAESTNSILEGLMDFIHPQYHSKIGQLKDMAAGMVMLASIVALAIGLVLFFPKFLDFLQ